MLGLKAYLELYDVQETSYSFNVVYSGKFKGYNANVRMRGRNITFSLSREWKNVDEDIQLGLLQVLLCKLFKVKKNTINMNFYHGFLKNVHSTIPKNMDDPELRDSFERINAEFFKGLLNESNLRWAGNSKRIFGSYDYGTDTITINPVLKGRPRLLDYVMFHEMLHKKFKFKNSFNRTLHHTPEFKKEEERFPDKKQLDKELSMLNSGNKKKRKLFHWF